MKWFTAWFKALSRAQAGVAYCWLLVAVTLIFWHSPGQGYEQALNRKQTLSLEVAQYKARELEVEMPAASSRYSWTSSYWDTKEGSPYGGYDHSNQGYFYNEKDPWWWLGSYESKGFSQDFLPKSLKVYLQKLGYLGTAFSYLGSITLVALILGWLFEIRKEEIPK